MSLIKQLSSRILRPSAEKKALTDPISSTKYRPIDFDEVNEKSLSFARLIEEKFEDIAKILLTYESFEVVRDETNRALDILKNLDDNRQYFRTTVNEVTVFLPRNQPLYAFTCFVIIPSLMANEVHFRIPHSMRSFFPKILELLEIERQFPNIRVSALKRLDFLRERSALLIDPLTEESVPVSDAVIFTGTSLHAEQLRRIFDSRTLFISNGSGHNPVVVAADADIDKAVEAVLDLQLYNQGQDCAAPNSILVHSKVYTQFLDALRQGIASTAVGPYSNRSCRVGPISDPKDLVRIQDFLIENKQYLDSSTQGTIHAASATVEPTIICKPLELGGNFNEIFAPIVMVQQYAEDKDLSKYFEDPLYPMNAMYITVYGSSAYVSGLVDRLFGGKRLHDASTILFNKHLHERGVERGVNPYGGYGHAASSVSIDGITASKPTLPQRDIFELLVEPKLANRSSIIYELNFQRFTKKKEKNVEKLLRILHVTHSSSGHSGETEFMYADIQGLSLENKRYVRLGAEQIYKLLDHPNAEAISRLQPSDLEHIKSLQLLVDKIDDFSRDEFTTRLYAIPKRSDKTDAENRARQLHFFRIIYLLLFGIDSGPRLAEFLMETDVDKVRTLLDV